MFNPLPYCGSYMAQTMIFLITLLQWICFHDFVLEHIKQRIRTSEGTAVTHRTNMLTPWLEIWELKHTCMMYQCDFTITVISLLVTVECKHVNFFMESFIYMHKYWEVSTISCEMCTCYHSKYVWDIIAKYVVIFCKLQSVT